MRIAKYALNKNSSMHTQSPEIEKLHSDKLKACDELGQAMKGDIGDIVAKHEKMILHYYKDVQVQAQKSFDSAKMVSWIGFGVLIITLIYTLVFDALAHFHWDNFTPNPKDSLTVGGIGFVSGLLIEFIAGVNFWLYGRAAKQFNAFHICLERTHRYLIAYKIGEMIGSKKDETLEKLVCIMANAPMITLGNINGFGEEHRDIKGTHVKAVSSEVETA
jgi:hypothetical protein